MPGHAVHKDHPGRGLPDLERGQLPDTVEEAREGFLERVEKLEKRAKPAD